MSEIKSKGTHTVMTRSLAEELIKSGMKHFDVGGAMGGPSVGGNGPLNTQMGLGSNGIDGFLGFNQYSASNPDINTQNFQPRIGNEQGQQDTAYNNQSNLANQLLSQSQGQGPNPAQSQLAQNTGQNVQTQGAMMASQRGANSNPALIARQSAQQGAATQQNSVGQAATLQAQQSLAAQQAAAGIYQNQATNSLQGESIQQGGQAAQNTAVTQGQLGAQNINSNVSGQNAQHSGNMLGNFLNGGGALSSMFYKGGPVQKFDTGGIANYSSPSVDSPGLTPFTAFADKPPSKGGTGNGVGGGAGGASAGGDAGGAAGAAAGGADAGGAAGGAAGASAGGGDAALLLLANKGAKVPGKPEKGRDAKGNDVVPALLSPGEEVIDLDTLNDPGPIGKMARTVAAHINAKNGDSGGDDGSSPKAEEFKKHLKSGGKKGFGGVLEARKVKKACGGGRM